MGQIEELLLTLVGLLALGSLVTDHLRTRTNLLAGQGAALGGLLLFAHWGEQTPYLIALAVLTIALKGVAVPYVLFRCVRESGVERGLSPYIGGVGALLSSAVAIGGAFALAKLLKLPQAAGSPLIVPISLATLFIGFLVLIGKKTAISQVQGYLILENGIFVFGFALATQLPVIVEMGVLLDVFVGVFIMGITISQMNHEFHHVDASLLRELQDEGAPAKKRGRR